MAPLGQIEVTRKVRYVAADLEEVIRELKASGKTGALTLHFSQGGIGHVEWSERVREQKTS